MDVGFCIADAAACRAKEGAARIPTGSQRPVISGSNACNDWICLLVSFWYSGWHRWYLWKPPGPVVDCGSAPCVPRHVWDVTLQCHGLGTVPMKELPTTTIGRAGVVLGSGTAERCCEKPRRLQRIRPLWRGMEHRILSRFAAKALRCPWLLGARTKIAPTHACSMLSTILGARP